MTTGKSGRATLATFGIPLAALVAALLLTYALGDPNGGSIALDTRDWLPYPFFALVSAVTVRLTSRGQSRPHGYLLGGIVYFAYTLLLVLVWIVLVTLNGGWG